MSFSKKPLSKFTITKSSFEDFVILSFESEEKESIIKDLEKLSKEKDFLVKENDKWKIINTDPTENKAIHLPNCLQNALRVLGFFEEKLERPFSRDKKYNCEFYLQDDTAIQPITIWYNKQLNCFKGGYFYTIAEKDRHLKNKQSNISR